MIGNVIKKSVQALFFCLFLSVIRRKLGFLGKEGYDIFGNNKMFAPRIKWQSLEDTVEHMKNAAESYEIAFNNIMSIEQSSQDYKQVSTSYHSNCLTVWESMFLTFFKML